MPLSDVAKRTTHRSKQPISTNIYQSIFSDKRRLRSSCRSHPIRHSLSNISCQPSVTFYHLSLASMNQSNTNHLSSSTSHKPDINMLRATGNRRPWPKPNTTERVSRSQKFTMSCQTPCQDSYRGSWGRSWAPREDIRCKVESRAISYQNGRGKSESSVTPGLLLSKSILIYTGERVQT